VRESGWIGHIVTAFQTPAFAGNPCPVGGAAVCSDGRFINLIEPSPVPPVFTPGIAHFDGKGLYRGHVEHIFTSNTTQSMIYRDPDASGSTGVAGAGSDGPLRWGAWTLGAYRTGGTINTATLQGTDSHYVVGKPYNTTLAASGSVSFAPIAGAASQAMQLLGLDETGAPTLQVKGALTAFGAGWDYATLDGSNRVTGNATMTVRMANGLDLNGTLSSITLMRMAELNVVPLGSSSTGQVSAVLSIGFTASDGVSCNRYFPDGVTLASSVCNAAVWLSLVGEPATHAVLHYRINMPDVAGRRRGIVGHAAVKR
jgi:hypothetical protein